MPKTEQPCSHRRFPGKKGFVMAFKDFCASMTAVAIIIASVTATSAQTPVNPSDAAERNPNPATSAGTDDDGSNPLAREGEHSPTGHNPSLGVTPSIPPKDSTVGRGSTRTGHEHLMPRDPPEE
jgi:hypothetical protein